MENERNQAQSVGIEQGISEINSTPNISVQKERVEVTYILVAAIAAIKLKIGRELIMNRSSCSRLHH